MPNDTTDVRTAFEAAARETLVTSLRNAHALEKQVVAVLEAQLKNLTDFPDLQARLTEHIVDTREQARRLEACLEACGSSASMVKDALSSIMGMGQSSVQGFSDDAVLKAMTADIMTEHLEIATYRSLLTLADMAGKPEIRPRLEESLREEEEMAEWFDENLGAITRRFVELKASEERRTNAAPPEDAASPDDEEHQTMWQSLENAQESSAHARPSAKPDPETAPDNASRDPDENTPRSAEKTVPKGGAA